MKSKKILFVLLTPLCLLLAVTSFAHDIDLYMASGQGVEANLLIMFDNSGSMNDQIQVFYYDPATTYDPLVVSQARRDAVYYRVYGGGWNLFANSIANVACPSARTALTNNGHYEGNTNSSCSRTNQTLRTGNYRNYLASIGGSEYATKLSIAKRVINDFLDTMNGVRIGVMVFNRAVTINGVSDSEGGRLQSSIKSLNTTTRSQLKTDINNITAETWTPLAETLYEAGLYFKGGSSYFNSGVVYTSPIQFHCQRNYVIIITDGDSTRDRNSILGSVIKDQDGDGREPGGTNEVHYTVDGEDMLGTDYLDDVAKYLYDIDLRSDLEEQQNIITYTIGFTVQSQHNLLERAAAKGHGRYFFSDNAQQLADAFQDIVNEILEKSSSFVAPLVPVSRMERTSAGDKIYIALFQPNNDGMWSGNIKKFGVAQENNTLANIFLGDIVDANGAAALDQDGQILATAKSFWTTISMDGGDVEKGGVGDVLRNRSSSRNIYTYLGSNVDLTNSSNAFAEANIAPDLVGLGTDTTARDNLVRFVHGYDAYDDNGNGNTTEKRDWILGSFLHSRPLLIHYETRSVIFAGSNDGMLHAFDDSNGSELWAFIPPNLLNKLQALHADVIESFVDGSPKAYFSYDSNGQITKAILIFGQRRGGNHYYALDITDPLVPKYLWKINPDMPDYAELGQTWSSPMIGKIAYLTGEKWVAFIGGGYDENQDNDPVTVPDSKGRAVYVVDVLDGSLLWHYSYGEDPLMAYSIPSDIQRVDTNGDGKIDRLYVGDMGGRIWRFDIKDSDPTLWTVKIIFNSNAGGEKRKIFYPPDVTLEKDSGDYEMLFFGTGDREHPKESTNINRLYSIKDKNPSAPLTETNLVDVTQDLLQDASTSPENKTTILNELGTKSGWFIKLDQNLGEKCLSSPVVYYGVVYYTSFAPNFGSGEGDPCFVGEGTGKLYALRYKSGNAAFNLDGLDTIHNLTRSDRAATIGTGIPSGVIITFIEGKTVAYVGVGGPGGPRVPKPKLLSDKTVIPVSWRIVF
jgi:type IV pilus assembly protein PilY1